MNISSTFDLQICKLRDAHISICEFLIDSLCHLPLDFIYLAFGQRLENCLPLAELSWLSVPLSVCWAWLITTQLPPHNKLINKLIQRDCLRVSCRVWPMLRRHAHRFHLDELSESKPLAAESGQK